MRHGRTTAHENAILRERPSAVGLRCANPTYGYFRKGGQRGFLGG
ncbi:MAG: hypothetical protein WBH61_09670 [Candidatus Methylomirabilis sp.]